MQISRSKIEGWLMAYDQTKPFWRRLFEHNAIKKLKTELRTHPRAVDFDYDNIIAFFTADPVAPDSLEDELRDLIGQENAELEQKAIASQTTPAHWLSVETLKERGLYDPDKPMPAYVWPRSRYTLMPAQIPVPSAPPAPSKTLKQRLEALIDQGFDMDSIPQQFLCPITMTIMERPASVATNPLFICERDVLARSVAENGRSPENEDCGLSDLEDAIDMRAAIETYVAQQEETFVESSRSRLVFQ